jgi:predicted sulfurtransferase
VNADRAAAFDLAVAVTGKVPPNSSDVTRFQRWFSKVPVLEPIDGAVLLFYQYCDVGEPQMLQEWQQALCQLLRLRGRIHVGAEGLNGTVGGSHNAIKLYKEALRTHSKWSHNFADMAFKESSGGRHCFPNLFVRLCREICQMNSSPEDIHWKDGGKHLPPIEFHQCVEEMNQNKTGDTVLLDVRNFYESEVGHFDGAGRIPTRHFTDFPKVADELIESLQLREKRRVLMYCTGGIRCERASAYLRSKGVTRCFQLLGGIHNYVEELGEHTLFRGRNFVFDRRLTTDRVGTKLPNGRCIRCGTLHDEYNKSLSCRDCCCLLLVCSDCRVTLTDDKVASENMYCSTCQTKRQTFT